MLIIRLSRAGAKKRPFYHIVVADSRQARGGRYIERLGYFNPVACGKEIGLHINTENLKNWQLKGAQLSLRVAKLVDDLAKSTAKAA
jgi:small subunit ribosomal protein S16